MKFYFMQFLSILFNILITMLIFVSIATISILWDIKDVYGVAIAFAISSLWAANVSFLKRKKVTKVGKITYFCPV